MSNYRNVYKSDHLGVVDLEELVEAGKPLIFTIKEVKQEVGATVAGNKGNFNIAYFKEQIKPWVLNSGNATTIRKLGGFGVNVEDWKNLTVELYIDQNVKMKGVVVGGIRVRPNLPQPKEKPVLNAEHANWSKCIQAVKDGITIEALRVKYNVSDETFKLLQDAAV